MMDYDGVVSSIWRCLDSIIICKGNKKKDGARQLISYLAMLLMGRSRLHKVISVMLLSLCLSIQAEDNNGWEFDSLAAKETSRVSDVRIIYELLLQMLDRWNAHDIEGYLACYWKSPELLIIVDSEQFNGWQQMHDSYTKGYPEKASMGFATPARIQVRFLDRDVALALTWWSISFPNSKRKVVGNSTMNLKKFDDGWKIVAAHSSTADL
jgi:uncharacterized protein (TIGR02246 family)